MLVQFLWLSSLLPIASSSTISSTHLTSQSTTMKPTLKSNSTYQISPTLTTSSTTLRPTSLPQTFYLVADVLYPGTYFKLVPNPYPNNPLYSDNLLQLGYKNSTGAANFTLKEDGTLQCNSESGPLYASLPSGKVGDFPWEFQDPSELDESGLGALTCSFGGGWISCQLVPLQVPFVTDDGILSMGSRGVQFVLLIPVPT